MTLPTAYAYVEKQMGDKMPPLRSVLDWWNRVEWMRISGWSEEEFSERLREFRMKELREGK